MRTQPAESRWRIWWKRRTASDFGLSGVLSEIGFQFCGPAPKPRLQAFARTVADPVVTKQEYLSGSPTQPVPSFFSFP